MLSKPFSISSLKKNNCICALCIYVCIHMEVREQLTRALHLLPCLRQGVFVVYCSVCQGSWHSSVWEFPYLCFSSHCTALKLQIHTVQRSLLTNVLLKLATYWEFLSEHKHVRRIHLLRHLIIR